MMSLVKLELRCLKDVDGIKADPDPNWSFDDILSELEEKLCASRSVIPVPFTKINSRDIPNGNNVRKSSRGYVMCVSDSDVEDMEDEGNDARDPCLLPVKRFTCDELCVSGSDESEDELGIGTQNDLMYREGLVESALFGLKHECHRGVMEEIRNSISALETELMESVKLTSALVKVKKYKKERRDFDMKHDTLYRCKMAEALDSHLTAIQRDHELRSQVIERKIIRDAANDEAKRREKALQEEKLRQEKNKAEAQAKLRAEAKIAALEEQKKAEKQSDERKAIKCSKYISAAEVKEGTAKESLDSKLKGLESEVSKKSEAKGDIIRASKSALSKEHERVAKLKELDVNNQILRSTSNMDFGRFERPLGRSIKQIRGIKDNVSTKARDIANILKEPNFPEAISIGAFAKKVVSFCESPDVQPFACGYVIVLVTSQVPHAMDILLAELHRACIFTVPKHILCSEMDCYRTLGFRDDNGELESRGDFLRRVESYMKLYGALVQTEVQGVPNRHGLEEGWAWLAKFLNALPANMFTAVALKAFLQVAGFALFRKYKSQFIKMLNVIHDQFLSALKARGNPELSPSIEEIQSYLEDKKYLQEPEGRTLQGNLLSEQFR